MTRPVPNTNSPLVDKNGKIINPWNIWFQQFSQQAPKVVTVTVSPYKANNFGTVIISGTVVKLTRGLIIITFGTVTNLIIPVSIGDIVSWTTASYVQFWET
jgi:hypothetical protein